jgi:hypothetical protein
MENTIEVSDRYESPKCVAVKKNGEPCKKFALESSVFCSAHKHLETPVEVKREKKKVEEEDVVDEERLARLNEATMLILDHLTPEVKKEFVIAAKEWEIQDISIYILGLLNRLYKTVDFYNADIEPEWQKRVVGYDDKLICGNCNQVIVNPTHLKQKFCCNQCSKEFSQGSKDTGVIYPSNRDLGTEAEQDAVAAETERARLFGA